MSDEKEESYYISDVVESLNVPPIFVYNAVRGVKAVEEKPPLLEEGVDYKPIKGRKERYLITKAGYQKLVNKVNELKAKGAKKNGTSRNRRNRS